MLQYPRIRDLRTDNNLRQEDIAQKLDTTQKQYSRWERGEHKIPFDIIIQLAKIYNISIDYIAELTDTKRSYR